MQTNVCLIFIVNFIIVYKKGDLNLKKIRTTHKLYTDVARRHCLKVECLIISSMATKYFIDENPEKNI